MLKNKLKLKVLLFLFQFTVICNAHSNPYSKLFNIEDYDIFDLKFEIIIKDLKKHLVNYYPLKNLDNFKINVYWLKNGKLDIGLANLPSGKKQIENEIKVRVLDKIRVFFPKDEIKSLSSFYNIKKENKRITATNPEKQLRKVVFDLDSKGLVSKISTYYPLNRVTKELFYTLGEGNKYRINETKEYNSSYKNNFLKSELFTYEKVSKYLLPVKIETIETIKISNNIPNKPKEKRTFKSEVVFLNFKINDGFSRKYFNNKNGKKHE
ncbi:hypothetical protein OAK75_11290 [Bacteriovoracales bacterium]|nr:hypothetical protein [Bacteriovoracales bacterium]